MKHFRKYQCTEIVETLHRVTGVTLEDSVLSSLYDILVVKGDHIQTENYISHSVSGKKKLF